MSHKQALDFGKARSFFHRFGAESIEEEENNAHYHPNLELDPKVLSRRQKQIDYGKNTKEYKNYVECVPFEKRGPCHPKTPELPRKYSRRAWDGLIKKWRLSLHRWTFPEPISLSQHQFQDNNNNYRASSSIEQNHHVSESTGYPSEFLQGFQHRFESNSHHDHFTQSGQSQPFYDHSGMDAMQYQLF